jgi:BON domain
MQFMAPRVRLKAGPTPTRFGFGRSAAANSLAIAAAAATCGMTLGALLAYFLDPKAGRRRRHTARDRAMSRARRGERRAAARARRAESHAVGIARRTINAARPRHREPFDDVTLARKVETEIFRAPDAPKGSVSVDVQNGIAHLRGEVADPEWIERLAAEARKVDGIRGVENMLHTPTPR